MLPASVPCSGMSKLQVCARPLVLTVQVDVGRSRVAPQAGRGVVQLELHVPRTRAVVCRLHRDARGGAGLGGHREVVPGHARDRGQRGVRLRRLPHDRAVDRRSAVRAVDGGVRRPDCLRAAGAERRDGDCGDRRADQDPAGPEHAELNH